MVDFNQLALVQKLNDGPTNLAYIALLSVYNGGTVAKGMFSFFPKQKANWVLVTGPASSFHGLTKAGNPFTPTSVADGGHRTTTSGQLVVELPSGTGLQDGDMTWLVANDDPLSNFTIDAR